MRRAVAALLGMLAAATITACDPAPWGREGAPATDQASVLLRFSRALVGGDYEAAHTLLAPPLAETLPPEVLRARYEAMIAWAGEPARETAIQSVLSDWPARRPGDALWAYASIEGDGFSEAVSGVITEQGLIREPEWGRP